MTDRPLLVERHMCPYCQRRTAYKLVRVNRTVPRWMCDSCLDRRQKIGREVKVIKVE